MSMPNLPEFPDVPGLTPEVVISYIILSIALEEIGLSHIINAEGEKIQNAVLNNNATLEDLISVNDSVEKTLRTVIKSQIVTEFKLQEALEFLFQRPQPEIEVFENTATVTATFEDVVLTDSDNAFYHILVA